jgi:solute carrier family 25 thiamine pyrophosphate transporter 19
MTTTSVEQAISGAIAGVCSRLVIAPLDVVKIRFQLQSERVSLLVHNPQQKYQSIFQSIRLIIKEEGIRGLWKGNVAATYLYFTYGGVQFWCYHQIKTNVRFC